MPPKRLNKHLHHIVKTLKKDHHFNNSHYEPENLLWEPEMSQELFGVH
jgi:hypothetical protein